MFVEVRQKVAEFVKVPHVLEVMKDVLLVADDKHALSECQADAEFDVPTSALSRPLLVPREADDGVGHGDIFQRMFGDGLNRRGRGVPEPATRDDVFTSLQHGCVCT